MADGVTVFSLSLRKENGLICGLNGKVSVICGTQQIIIIIIIIIILLLILVHSNLFRLIGDGGKGGIGGDGYLCPTIYSLHCHRQNGSAF